MAQFDPNRPDFTPYGLSCVRWVPSPMQRPDHHNEIELNLLQKGSVTYLFGGRKVRIEAGSLGAFWAAIPHQVISFAPDTSYFVTTIPLAWFLQCRLSERFIQHLMQGAMVCESDAKRRELDAQLFASWERDLATGAERARDIVMLEIEARLQRLECCLPSASEQKRRQLLAVQAGGLNKVEQMACFVAQHYVEPLTVSQISEAAGLHPNYAMNLFKKAFGTTLVDYLVRHRVSHAQRLLVTTDLKMVDVAFSSGFNSISRFNEAFRQACGCTPRDYRAAHIGAAD